ncbi:DUF1513 domain-containing protein [Thiocystis violascens]|uniref:DUF1513 domain-containing protein n=1 Tax=Thiocystis violascens (strain ATCC 17096 / DSM 198 / 6111) TaxID=765911 RepID=I3Y5I1_THIV6|nr:DUF1513 domain-containing protein [Thiocystis violascens]AFL72249.1 hypothetical protein Thivi_0176 [Thiocystis violascens DSM 198]
MRDPLDRRRRRLLAGLGLAALPLPRLGWTKSAEALPEGRLVSAFYAGKGEARRDWLVWSEPAGTRGGRLELPLRGHGLCRHPGKPDHVVCFARRPGDRLWEIDLKRGAITADVPADEGHYFFGHGVFSHDGTRLYTTENRYRDSTGLVRVRDAQDYRVLDEMPSGGIGPHDVRLLSDGRTLAVANGGIETHPDLRRRKLNLATMDPSLAYLDSASGRILEQHRLPHHQLSIRHLGVGASGTALVTCPKSNLVTLWNLTEARLIASYDIRQPYGAALACDGAYLITGATGEVHRLIPGGTPERIHTATGVWDNHLLWLDPTQAARDGVA